MDQLSLDVVVTRGALVESHHRVHAAVVNAAGALIGAAHDPGFATHWRSCAKPFQIMPFIESGGFDQVGWGDDQLALACASHGGEPEHVAIAEGMLAAIGMEEGDLACGPHDPLSSRGQKMLREAGTRTSRLHNNCSGKHASMLAFAHAAGWPAFGYERQDHPVQQACLASVSSWGGVPAAQIVQAVDGCGVVDFGLTLRAMSHAYARFGDAVRRSQEVPSRVAHGIGTRPFLFGGTDRFDSAIIEATEGRVLSKVGAEGVHCAAIIGEGIGIAIKVEDGGQRAQFPALIAALQHYGALPAELPPRLQEFALRSIRNTRSEIVGEVRRTS